ncbi:hypothetical protein HanXRQr2_Chr06g0262531 [Helianthus annuus]|uniref:Uncharacterized protein n=2 Tax=Helianthus annuus TaxID=4232 RepID=A0A9K3ITG8_HELAN|nr:hypothetical protein HanXRQr2_Chr06g0262531 [Helianthus annuus]KAJ0915726.1 hypothetical protein HanPSC8_Chr06g0253201 [Helianthus annuus]
MDPNVFAYAQMLASAGSQPFFQVPQTIRRFATVSGDRNGTGDTTRTRARCRGIQTWEKVSQKERYNHSSSKRGLPSMDERLGVRVGTFVARYIEGPRCWFFGKRFVKRSLKLWGKKKITAKNIPFLANGPISTRNVISFKRSFNAIGTTWKVAKTTLML